MRLRVWQIIINYEVIQFPRLRSLIDPFTNQSIWSSTSWSLIKHNLDRRSH